MLGDHSNMSDFEEIMMKYQKEAEKNLQEYKENLLNHLKLYPTAAKITISYSGSGDSGNIDEAQVWDRDGDPIDINKDLELAIDNYTFNLLTFHYGGWEINDGSQGTIIINDLVNLSGKIEHTQFYTESKEEETTF